MRRIRSTPIFIAVLAIIAYFVNPLNLLQGSRSNVHMISEAPPAIAVLKNEGFHAGGYIYAEVVKAVDGDTLEIEYKNKDYKVRLLDVDTPESVKKGVELQPYSREASEFTKARALHRQVKLVFEKDMWDQYGRLLAHIFLKDGSYLNAMLVRNGYARVEIVKPNTLLSDYFYDLEAIAIEEKAGLWGLRESNRPFVKDEKGHYIPKYWIK